MFKKQGISFEAETYLNIYNGCNSGCPFCKFNKIKTEPRKNSFNVKEFRNKKVLISYSTEPLPFRDNSYTVNVINELHSVGAKILFLTRHPDRLLKIIDCFNLEDIIGVSISENIYNDYKKIEKCLFLAKEHNIQTWISLEPVQTYDFVSNILDKFKDITTYIRVGKLDGIDDNISDWKILKGKIILNYSPRNIFVKECK